MGYGSSGTTYGRLPYKDQVLFTVDFTGAPVSGTSPLTVEFTNSSSSAIWSIVAWLWDFGDGMTSMEENPTHTYVYPGTYTVSLTAYGEGYGSSYVPDEDEQITPDLNKTETKEDYITASAPEGKTLTGACLRFATEENEGSGWSEFDGSDFVDPVELGAYVIQDDNDVPRCIVEDEDGVIYEIDTYDRINYSKPSFVDKADFDGTGGTEISGERLGMEETAGPGKEDSTISDQVSWIQVRPDDPDNRSKDGYDSSGMREYQGFGLEVYSDGEKITPTATTVNVPENGDLRFAGHPNIESGRLQYSITFAASEFKLVETKHQILVKDSNANPDGVTMVEYNCQKVMSQNMLMWITRGKEFRDQVSKTTFSYPGGKISGPDSFTNSAFYLSAPEELIAVPTVGTITYWTEKDAEVGLGIGDIIPSATSLGTITVGGVIWSLVYDLNFGGSGLVVLYGSGVTRLFDFRIYSDVKNVTQLTDYFNDVKNNHGNAYLPGYIS